MKLFNRIKNAAKKFSKKALLVTGSILAAGALGAGFVQAEFYPDRPVFDYNKGSASSNCADPNDPGYSGGRCGSLNGPVFNSFINTPSYGDERMFADARRTDQTAAGSYENTVTDVTSGSKELIIRTYVHNNANQSDNASGKGVAHDTKVKILLPTGTSNGLRARSYISASNAAMVEDTVDFTAPENFRLEYIPGSATLVNSGFRNGVKLSDSIVTDGALIGSNALNGDLNGCFDYASVVEIHVKVVPETKPANTFTKQVAVSGMTAWGETVTTKPGDTVKWLLNFKNTGTADLTNVNISDVLPPHLTVVPGSVKYTDASGTTVQGDAPLFGTGGINFGTWKPNGGFYVRFDTVTKDDFTGCEVTLRNIGYNKADQTPKVQDTADVVIKKQNCVVVTPTVVCDALTAPKLTLKVGESTVFTAKGTATNTTISGYTFKVNGQVVQDSASDKYTFTQNAAGSYTVTVDVKSPIGTVTTPACAKTVTVEEEKTPVVTCDALTAPKLSLKKGESTTFTATGTATNTTISGYTFKVNGQVVQDSASNTYVFTQNTAGTYTVDVTVKSPAGNVTSPACAKTVHVQEEVTPIYSCDAFSLSSANVLVGQNVKISVNYTATNSASFKQATFNFGDTKSYTTNNSANGVVSADHSYDKKGNYAITVKLEFTVNGETKVVEGGKCVGQVNVTAEKCPIPGKEQYDKNDTVNCNDVKGVTTIPNTGAGNFLGIFAAVTAAGAALHSYFTRRSMNR